MKKITISSFKNFSELLRLKPYITHNALTACYQYVAYFYIAPQVKLSPLKYNCSCLDSDQTVRISHLEFFFFHISHNTNIIHFPEGQAIFPKQIRYTVCSTKVTNPTCYTMYDVELMCGGKKANMTCRTRRIAKLPARVHKR